MNSSIAGSAATVIPNLFFILIVLVLAARPEDATFEIAGRYLEGSGSFLSPPLRALTGANAKPFVLVPVEVNHSDTEA
jgi:hypothetical protein